MAGSVLRVLVVDDEKLSARATAAQLNEAGYVGASAHSAFDALDRLREGNYDVVLSDYRMPHMDGIELLRRVKEIDPTIFVILMSAFGTVDTAVEAMQLGASDFLTKPFPFGALAVRLKNIHELCAARHELRSLRALLGEQGDTCEHGMVGRCPQLRRACEQVRVFAQASAPVLVVGETGTGKELIARALHHDGPRRARAFVAMACGAIPPTLAETELFGHDKGAFTGAIESRPGCFERAHGGTLLLDDVDDLPREIQVKLLRVLQEGTITRVGGAKEIPVDVRVVATSKVDLAGVLHRGLFRDDLFYRLRGLEIALPPLRERGVDVLLLAAHFLRLLAGDRSEEPKKLMPDACAVLSSYHWPGNVRELRRAMESADVSATGPEVTATGLPDYLRLGAVDGHVRLVTLHLDERSTVPFREVLADVEARLIAWAMRRARGNQQRAAELLQLPRSTLQNKTRG